MKSRSVRNRDSCRKASPCHLLPRYVPFASFIMATAHTLNMQTDAAQLGLFHRHRTATVLAQVSNPKIFLVPLGKTAIIRAIKNSQRIPDR